MQDVVSPPPNMVELRGFLVSRVVPPETLLLQHDDMGLLIQYGTQTQRITLGIKPTPWKGWLHWPSKRCY